MASDKPSPDSLRSKVADRELRKIVTGIYEKIVDTIVLRDVLRVLHPKKLKSASQMSMIFQVLLAEEEQVALSRLHRLIFEKEIAPELNYTQVLATLERILLRAEADYGQEVVHTLARDADL